MDLVIVNSYYVYGIGGTAIEIEQLYFQKSINFEEQPVQYQHKTQVINYHVLWHNSISFVTVSSFSS